MKKTIIGYSRLGREIPLFHSGRGDAAVLIIGGIHAREHITCDLTYELWRTEGKTPIASPVLIRTEEPSHAEKKGRGSLSAAT